MNEKQKTTVLRSPDLAFLRTELATGLTLSGIALRTTHVEKRRRNRANAKKAYDAVLHFLPGTQIPPEQEDEIRTKLEELKGELRLLGETI